METIQLLVAQACVSMINKINLIVGHAAQYGIENWQSKAITAQRYRRRRISLLRPMEAPPRMSQARREAYMMLSSPVAPSISFCMRARCVRMFMTMAKIAKAPKAMSPAGGMADFAGTFVKSL